MCDISGPHPKRKMHLGQPTDSYFLTGNVGNWKDSTLFRISEIFGHTGAFTFLGIRDLERTTRIKGPTLFPAADREYLKDIAPANIG